MNVTSDERQNCASPAQEFSFLVLHGQAGIRLDHCLVQKFPELSRSQLSTSVSKGLVFVNGHHRKNSYRLKEGETISGTTYQEIPFEIVAEKIDFEIIYEDPFLMVISKPPNLVVHPGSGNPNNTLANGLVYYCQTIEDVGDPVRPGIVHRLDKDTSGIMVVAKNNYTHRKLSEAFKNREVEKKYHALLLGTLKEKEGRIVAPIGRHNIQRQKMAVVETSGKYAASTWSVVDEFDGKYSLVELGIETGRTHQIRVHMAHIGNPVAGDLVYGKRQIGNMFPRQMLHASRLMFLHPENGNKMNFVAPLWPDFRNVLEMFQKS